MGTIDLEAVLARVACAADDDGLAADLNLLEGVEHELGTVQAERGQHQRLCLGSLDGELGVVVALVLGLGVEALDLLLNPGVVLVDVGSVDDEEEVVLAHLIDEQVIHSAAVGIEHHAVEDLAHVGSGHVVRKDVLHEALSLRTRDAYFAHVANVEDADLLTYGIVLRRNVGIDERHVEAAKGHHLGAECYMLIM